MEFKDFYKKINEYLEIQFFLHAYQFVRKSGVAPKSSSEDILKVLAYLHEKGWLYYSYEQDKLVTVIGAYRIKEFDESRIDILPEKEEGNILFVPINASISKDKFVYRRLLKNYIKDNKVEELIFFNRNSNELKRYKIKGEKSE